jgi:DNA polymerase delta subunit 3
VTKSLYEYTVKEDSSKAAEKYGIIGNSSAKRRNRTSKAVAPAPAKPPVKPAAPTVKAEPAVKAESSSVPASTKVKQESAVDKAIKKESAPTSSASKPAAPAKKGGAGGIMQSFAKAAAKPKPKKEPVKEEPALSDDGEADEDDIPTIKTSPRALEARREAQKKRTEYLRRMMEESSDEDEDKKAKDEDEEMEEAPEPEEEPEPEPEPEPAVKKADEGPSEVISSTEGGRRRGKRRVMQKKRILDDEGFMGTYLDPGVDHRSRLTRSSHDTGARMGVLLGGRGATSSQKAHPCTSTDTDTDTGIKCREAQEASTKDWPGEHHVVLLQKVMNQLMRGCSMGVSISIAAYLLASTKLWSCSFRPKLM